MKPLKLTIQAFGPYSSKTVIDFRKFNSQGFFLISGDTGSGKTTIFDGISYALFDKTSGLSRGINSIRSDFATIDTFTEVIFEFLHKENEYTIRRFPDQLRKGKRSDRLVQQKKGVSIKMPDGTVLDSLTQVNEIITDILGGLGYEQFKQISMIAQGEFLDLLLADNDKRNDILQKVFNTSFYQKIGESLREKENQLKRQNEDIIKSMLQYVKDIKCDKSSDFFDKTMKYKEENNIYQIEDILKCLNEMIQQEEEEIKELQTKIDRLSTDLEGLIKEEEKAFNTNLELEELKELEIKQKQLKSKEAKIHNLELKSDLAQYALTKIKPFETNKNMKEKIKKDGLKKVEEGRKEKEELEYKLEIAKQNYDLEKGKESLKEELNNEINQLKKSLVQYTKLEELVSRKKEKEEKYKKTKSYLKDLEIQIKEKTEKKENIKKQIEELHQVPYEKLECENKLERQYSRKKKYENLYASLKRIGDLEVISRNSQKQYKKAEKDYTLSKDKYEKNHRAFLREQAGILAQSIKEEEPCPVCGSTIHPNLATIEKGAPTESVLKDMEARTNELLVKLQSSSKQAGENKRELKTRMNHLMQILVEENIKVEKEEVEHIKDVIGNYSHKNKGMIENLEKNYKILENKNKLLDQNKAYLEKVKEELKKYNVFYEENNNAINTLKIDLNNINYQIDRIKEELEYSSFKEGKQKLREKEDKLVSLKERFIKAEKEYNNMNTKLETTKRLLIENKKSLEVFTLELEESIESYLEAIKNSPLKEEKTYHSHLLSQDEIDEIKRRCRDYEIERRENLARLQSLKEKTEGKIKVDLKEIKAKVKTIKRRKDDFEASHNQLFIRVSGNKDIRVKLKKLNKQRLIKNQEYLEVASLSKTANGRLEGKQKITFETFIQTTYFSQIINQANKRFYDMSGKRYKLLRKEEGNIRSFTGLELNVFDTWTGKTRDVKSLSGGESFMAALSLALGFSDIIQGYSGGIEINTLFVDEGFGSLDSNALEQSIAILSSLTRGDRLVGIISHVDELKEKIPNQILIKKDIGGSCIEKVMYEK